MTRVSRRSCRGDMQIVSLTGLVRIEKNTREGIKEQYKGEDEVTIVPKSGFGDFAGGARSGRLCRHEGRLSPRGDAEIATG